MTHLLAQLLRDHDPSVIILVLLEALIGSGIFIKILFGHNSRRMGPLVTVLLFGIAVTLVSWLAFIMALAGTFHGSV